MSLNEEQEVFDNLMSEAKEEPAQVIVSILASTAPPPATSEERHSELETKVVRECIREYTKGDMYFAYNFGIDLCLISFVIVSLTYFYFRYNSLTATQARTNSQVTEAA